MPQGTRLREILSMTIVIVGVVAERATVAAIPAADSFVRTAEASTDSFAADLERGVIQPLIWKDAPAATSDFGVLMHRKGQDLFLAQFVGGDRSFLDRIQQRGSTGVASQ